MVVYAEYAFLENFLLDGLLLYLALKCARGKVRALNLFFAAAIGAGEALAFPLIPFPPWAAYLVKFLGGALLVAVSVSKGTGKVYLVTALSFFLFTFALGGILTAAYSFFGVEYREGSGYLVERAPVGLVLGCAGVFAVVVSVCVRRLWRYRKTARNLFDCALTVGDRTVHWKGLADSGNLLTFRGEPVCVISAAAVFSLFGKNPRAEGHMRVGTVNGGRVSPVFVCDGLSVDGRNARRVFLTVGEVCSKAYQLILHTALVEESHETHTISERTHRKGSGRRKRCSLSLRK